MATIEEAIVAAIEANVPTAGKGYPIEIPSDAAFPAWSYQVIDRDQLLAHSGSTGLFDCRIQIDIVAKGTASKSDYQITREIASAIRTFFDGYVGTLSGREIKYCKIMDQDGWADTHQLPTASLDVKIKFR